MMDSWHANEDMSQNEQGGLLCFWHVGIQIVERGYLILDTTLVASLPFALVACISSLLEWWGGSLGGGYPIYLVLRMVERELHSSEGGGITCCPNLVLNHQEMDKEDDGWCLSIRVYPVKPSWVLQYEHKAVRKSEDCMVHLKRRMW